MAAQSSICHFFTSPGSSASMASTEIEESKSDEQLVEKLQSDEEAQSSEAFSKESSI